VSGVNTKRWIFAEDVPAPPSTNILRSFNLPEHRRDFSLLLWNSGLMVGALGPFKTVQDRIPGYHTYMETVRVDLEPRRPGLT
jgi:hypothetical protein